MSILSFFNDKEKRYKENCPTNVLLYLATMRQCPVPVNPWYDVIKEYVQGANWHYPEFHQACVLGMFPELKDAAQYFNGALITRLGNLRDSYRAKGEALPMDVLNKTLKVVEDETIAQFNLPQTLF
ncbi:MAG: hypothetical protein II942_03520, partial [Alphaproteobacteria bacterium]|nr:hypothetical protein [Alphaproteobacteria bacterium]